MKRQLPTKSYKTSLGMIGEEITKALSHEVFDNP